MAGARRARASGSSGPTTDEPVGQHGSEKEIVVIVHLYKEIVLTSVNTLNQKFVVCMNEAHMVAQENQVKNGNWFKFLGAHAFSHCITRTSEGCEAGDLRPRIYNNYCGCDEA